MNEKATPIHTYIHKQQRGLIIDTETCYQLHPALLCSALLSSALLVRDCVYLFQVVDNFR